MSLINLSEIAQEVPEPGPGPSKLLPALRSRSKRAHLITPGSASLLDALPAIDHSTDVDLVTKGDWSLHQRT